MTLYRKIYVHQILPYRSLLPWEADPLTNISQAELAVGVCQIAFRR
jgi:hypothetical protein